MKIRFKRTPKFYIWHEDLQTPTNGIGIFGPFSAREIDKRLNDSYADGLASFGNVECVVLSRRQVKKLYINPRRYWMQQLKKEERY